MSFTANNPYKVSYWTVTVEDSNNHSHLYAICGTEQKANEIMNNLKLDTDGRIFVSIVVNNEVKGDINLINIVNTKMLHSTLTMKLK